MIAIFLSSIARLSFSFALVGNSALIITPAKIRAKTCTTDRLLLGRSGVSGSSIDEAEVPALLRRRKDEKTDILPGESAGGDVPTSAAISGD